MDNALVWVFGAALFFIGGYVIGQDDGLFAVARSCEKVGAFYIRDKTFKCEAAR